jgi:hypothetical protein
MLTKRRTLVVIVGVLLALAWAIPSLGASAGKVARTALVRANQAFHNANLATSNSNTAKNVSNQANATAGAANNTANTANSNANSAKTTANQALSVANNADEVESTFEMSFNPGNIDPTSCVSDSFSRVGVLSSDEVIVTPPSTQPLGIITQAYTSTSSITLAFCNVTDDPAGIDPPLSTYEFSTLR